MRWRKFTTSSTGDVAAPNLFDARVLLIRFPISRDPALRADYLMLFATECGERVVVRAAEVDTMRMDGLTSVNFVCNVRSSTIGEGDRDLVSWVEMQDGNGKGGAPASLGELVGRSVLDVECMCLCRIVVVCRAVEWAFDSESDVRWDAP